MAKILVVDDELGIGEVLREILSDERHQVALATNGRQGLEMVAREKPDLVFLDFMMPILNGAGMLRLMRANPEMAGIPVVIMSSLPEATIVERAPGHDAFVRKPFRIDVIVEIAEAILADRDRTSREGDTTPGT